LLAFEEKSERMKHRRMKEISREKYDMFLKSHEYVMIDNVRVRLIRQWKIQHIQPSSFSPEEWSVWSFPERGDWATHTGNYRGNWSPFIPRNLILKYTAEGDLVCDPMMGSGTTMVECKLTNRNGVGVDINPSSVIVAMNRLDFDFKMQSGNSKEPQIRLFTGDARNLDQIEDETVDLVAAHPPYAGIISYSRSGVPGDLSSLKFEDFMQQMGMVADECFRILKPGKHCAVLIGDTRKHRHYVPISIGVLNAFLASGFVLKEEIIKLQHNTLTSRGRWSGHRYDFYKIGHEHLYIFRKLDRDEKENTFRNSRKWW